MGSIANTLIVRMEGRKNLKFTTRSWITGLDDTFEDNKMNVTWLEELIRSLLIKGAISAVTKA